MQNSSDTSCPILINSTCTWTCRSNLKRELQIWQCLVYYSRCYKIINVSLVQKWMSKADETIMFINFCNCTKSRNLKISSQQLHGKSRTRFKFTAVKLINNTAHTGNNRCIVRFKCVFKHF